MHPDPSVIAIAMVPDKIGTADYLAGRKVVAIKAWEAALANNAKLFAPRINLAIARYEDRRPNDRANITQHAQTALAVERHPGPLVLLAALALADKKQEDFAKYALDEARGVDEDYAAAYVGLGVIAGRREQWPLAISHFERAAELEPVSDATRLALALAYLRVGRFDAAAAKLAAIKTATYDVELARGVAARGLGKHADAKAAYERAIKLDATRTEAARNLRTPRSPAQPVEE